MTQANPVRSVDLLWEIPLSVLSWIFFKLNKGLIGFLYQRYLSKNLNRAVTWRMISAETLKIPIILPVLMTKGPRWNTHGVIGTLGPFAVESTLNVDLAIAQRSAKSWTVVVYDYPAYETVTQLSWLKSIAEQNHGVLELPKGYYSLGIRYYGVSDQAEMPTVQFDQGSPLQGIPVPQDNNQFYDSLSDRTNIYYRALHYYIYTLLRLKQILPAGLIRGEYLPVGDPDTTFRYDCFEASQALNITVNPALFQDYWVYLTAYNRASLPILSEEITAPAHQTAPFLSQGYYLFRIRPKTSQACELKEGDVQVVVVD